MRIEIEIPEEDIEKLEELLRAHPDIFAIDSSENIRDKLKDIFQTIGEQTLRTVFEGLIGVSSGAIHPDELLGRVFLKGLQVGSKHEKEE